MPDGTEMGGGGLFSTTEDNLRLMKLYANGGVWDNERILAEDYVKRRPAFRMSRRQRRSEIRRPEITLSVMVIRSGCASPKAYTVQTARWGSSRSLFRIWDMLIAITENASGAHWAQAILDTMWVFLRESEKPAAGK